MCSCDKECDCYLLYVHTCVCVGGLVFGGRVLHVVGSDGGGIIWGRGLVIVPQRRC